MTTGSLWIWTVTQLVMLSLSSGLHWPVPASNWESEWPSILFKVRREEHIQNMNMLLCFAIYISLPKLVFGPWVFYSSFNALPAARNNLSFPKIYFVPFPSPCPPSFYIYYCILYSICYFSLLACFSSPGTFSWFRWFRWSMQTDALEKLNST